MYPNMVEKLPRAFIGVALMCALNFSSAAFSQEKISSKKSLEVALEDAVMCKTEALGIFSGGEFDGGPDDPQKPLEALGVSMTNQDKHGGTRFILPQNINVFGYEASEAIYFDSSTTLFFIVLRADSNRLGAINKTLRLVPVPKGNPDGYGYFEEFDARYIRKLDGGKVQFPYTIFSAIDHDQVVIGCQNLAW